MWACVSGCDDSGKRVITEWLVREGFQDKTQNFDINYFNNDFFKEIHYASSYLNTALQCIDVMFNQHVFSYRSIWEHGEVFLPLAKKMQEITSQEYNVAYECYERLRDVIMAPTCFIYCKIEKRNAFDRAMLKGKGVNEMRIIEQIRLYDEFFEKVRTPVLEIDMNKPLDVAIKDLDFSVQSMKASKADIQTLWKRTVF